MEDEPEIIKQLREEEKRGYLPLEPESGPKSTVVFTLVIIAVIFIGIFLFSFVGIFQEPAPTYEEMKQRFIGRWELDSQMDSMYEIWTFYENNTVKMAYSYYDNQPDITFSKNETQNTLTVTKVERQDYDYSYTGWSDYEIRNGELRITPDYYIYDFYPYYNYEFLDNDTKVNLDYYGNQMTFVKTSESAVNQLQTSYDIEWKNVNITLDTLDTVHWDWINLTRSSISYYGDHAPYEWGNITVGDVIHIGDYGLSMINVIINWIPTNATLDTWNFNSYDITISEDNSFPSWGEYDYAINSDNVRVVSAEENYTIETGIENLGLCMAVSSWGWASSDGRSCWGEWDFEYETSHVTDVSFRVADNLPEPGAKYRIELDGVHLGDAQITANTSWYIVTIHNVSINEGKHTLFLGTYQMDFNPDIYLDYIAIGTEKIEAEKYNRMGGNDPNTDLQGLFIIPADIIVQFWDGNPDENGTIISEKTIGLNQNAIDHNNEYSTNTFTTHYIPSNGVYTVITSWNASEGDHIIYVLIDTADELMETNEENNLAVKMYTALT